MGKRALLLFAAVIFFILGNTRPGCVVAVDGQDVPSVFSPLALMEAETAAKLALDEIAEGQIRLPTLTKRYRLCIKRPEGAVEVLSHRIITASGQAALLHRISAGGRTLGYVQCAAVLKERLHQYAYSHFPQGATGCRLSAELEVRPVYCRSNRQTDYGDMLHRILEVSPLIYSA